VTDQQKKTQAATVTKYALETRKVTGTPTVFLNGKQLDLQTQLFVPSALEKAVTDAGAGAKK
jgi:protein-disulfide isomerase